MRKCSLMLMGIVLFGLQSMAQKPIDEESHSFIVLSDGLKEVILTSEPNKEIKTNDYFIYSWYHRNAVHRTQGSYSGSLLHGEYTAYYKGNILQSKGEFIWGIKDGVWLYWRKDSSLEKQENWKKGLLEGKVTLYNYQGQDSLYIPYHKGKVGKKAKQVDGNKLLTVEVYDKDGNLREERNININDQGVVTESEEGTEKEKEFFLKRWFGKKDDKEQKDKDTNSP